MNKITVGNSTYYAAEGERLSDVLIRNGLSVEHPCGGRGVCGKCRVTVNGREELSCRYEVRSDITVTLPKKDEMVSVTGATESGKQTECAETILAIIKAEHCSSVRMSSYIAEYFE